MRILHVEIPDVITKSKRRCLDCDGQQEPVSQTAGISFPVQKLPALHPNHSAQESPQAFLCCIAEGTKYLYVEGI